MTVNPKATKEFTIYVRVPNRTTSELYKPVPQVSGLKSLKVNGQSITPKIENGYAAIKRSWKKGDKIELVLPMEIQKIKADENIEADKGRIALRYGPLIYNVEAADQPNIEQSISKAPLSLEWRPQFLNGVMVIKGKWSDGTDLVAIPNYTRLNRTEPTDYPKAQVTQPAQANQPATKVSPSSIIWIKDEN